MRILWITNVELPIAANYHKRNVFVGSWLQCCCEQLSLKDNIELHITSKSNEAYDEILIDNVYYSSFTDKTEDIIDNLLARYDFDVIHIWGTEYPHSLYAAKLADHKGLLEKTVISIQGLAYYCAKYHYSAFMPEEAFARQTIVEALAGKNNRSRRNQMLQRGYKELECLKLVKNCIGRTDWDEMCVKLINPDIHYFYCNELMRKGFYNNEWNIDKCNKQTIFFSQAYYPIKGFHLMLEALALIKQYYPHVKLKALGGRDDIIQKIKAGSYRNYILSLIKEYDLKENVEWLGNLNEEQMIKEYLSCNVFVCASSIENSSNSIGEAMLLGVPVVASDVGGIKSIMKHKEEGILYQSDAPYMLAGNVMNIFRDDEMAVRLGSNARQRALKDHDIETNMSLLMDIYDELSGK